MAPASVAGRQHHPAAAEDRQEGNPQGGVESHPRGPEGHGRSANAARGESQRSSEGGEKRAFSAPQRGANTARPSTRNRRLHAALKTGHESAQLVAVIVGVVECVG